MLTKIDLNAKILLSPKMTTKVRTELLTYGYIKEIQQSNISKIIPKDIIRLTFLFVSDYYSNHGEYTWKITDPDLIKTISSAEVNQQFESPTFQMAKLFWKMIITMGQGDRLNVLLKPCSFGADWDRIQFFRMIDYKERKYKGGFISTKRPNDTARLIGISVFASDIIKDGSITLKITVMILKVLLHLQPNQGMDACAVSNHWPWQKKYHFEYHVDEYQMTKMRTARGAKNVISSEIMDDTWVLLFYPNGSKVQNFAEFYIRICRWPAYTKQVNVAWSVKCEETGDVFAREKDNNMAFKLYCDYETNVNGQAKGRSGWFPSSNLKDYKSITFTVDIEIVEIVLMDKKDIKYEEITDPLILSTELNACRETSKQLSHDE